MSPVAFEVRRLSRLAAPLVTAQLAAMSLWVVDVLMLGRVGVEALDAAALGRLWLMSTSVVVMGLLLGLDPVAAQAYGAGDRRALVLAGQRGLVTVVLLTPLWLGLTLATGPALRLLGQEEALAAVAHRYVLAQLPGLPCFYAYVVLRHWLQAQGRMKPVMWGAITVNGVNVFANWVLIFGNLGFPALGAVGAGIATGLSFAYLFAFVAFAAHALGAESPFRGWRRETLEPRAVGRLLALGAPVGAQIGLEYWAFSVSTVWAGWLGADQLAAHTIVVSISALAFMVPMGISFATVTRVGNLIGARDFAGAQRAGWVALGMAVAAMTVTAVGLVAGRWLLPRAYTDDLAVLAFCASILPVAGAFQVGDGVQVVGAGILRGMGRTVPAALIMFLGFYAVALPLAYLLAFRAGAGLVGIWWGLAAGLTVVALLLVLWLRRRGPASLGPGGPAAGTAP
jgi:MATE family multidrug resistance protein